MTRLIASLRALACAALLSAAVGAPAALAAARQPLRPAHAVQARGTVVSLGWSSFTIRIGGRRMSVVRALTAGANAVTQGD